jgi:hypothetical protein
MNKHAIANKAEQFTNQTFLSLLDTELNAPYFKGVPKSALILALGVPLKSCMYNYMNRCEYGNVMSQLFAKGDTQAIQEYHSHFVTKHAPEAIQVVLRSYHPKYQPQV